jgi:hypothetical protein
MSYTCIALNESITPGFIKSGISSINMESESSADVERGVVEEEEEAEANEKV